MDGTELTPEQEAQQAEEKAMLDARLAEQKSREEAGLSEANAFANVDPSALPSALPPAELKPQPLPRVMTQHNLEALGAMAPGAGPVLLQPSAPQPAASAPAAAPSGYGVISVATNEFKITHNGVDLGGKILNPVEAGAILSWLRSLPV